MMGEDFMEVYNRYPEQFKKVSIIQFEPDRVVFDEKEGMIKVKY